MTAHRPTLLEALALASPFRGRTEDIAVEALGHILSTSEAARATLSDVVDTGGAQVGPIVRMRTQVTGKKSARPDLAGFDESGLERVLIEAKFAAGLTENQPVAYLKGQWLRLAGVDVWFGIHFDRWVRSPTALLWLWFRRELLQARRETGIALEPLRSRKPQELFDDDEGGLLVPVPLPLKVGSDALGATVTAWRDSLALGAELSDVERRKYEAMLEPVLDAMVARLEEVRQLLRGTSRRRDTKRNGAVTPARRSGRASAAAAAGMRKDFPRRVGSLRRLVDDATDRGRGEGWADTSGFRATSQRSGCGRYLRLGRVARAEVWFGIQFWGWLQRPPTPLWLSFTSNSLQRRERTRGALEPLRGKNPSELIDDNRLRTGDTAATSDRSAPRSGPDSRWRRGRPALPVVAAVWTAGAGTR